MSFRVEVVIPGEPIGQGRPRFARRGTFVTAYDPPKSRDWKSGARACMMAALPEPARLPFPAGKALTVTVHAVFSRPAGSYSKRTPKGREVKITRPDTENVVKAVLDAGTGTLWHDDSQVWRLTAWKEIGAQDEAPFVRLTVSDEVAA